MSTDTQKTTTVPFDWLKKISPSALANDEIPLFGTPPAFPWEELIQLLKSKLHVEQLEISRSNITQRTEEELLLGIGSPYKVKAVSVSPINQNVLFVMSEQEISRLMSALLTHQEPILHLENEFIEPFFTFMFVEAINALSNIQFDNNLSFAVVNEATPSLPTSTTHCCDITININRTLVTGRLILPADFRHAWKSYYTPKELYINLSSRLAENLEMIIQIEAGRVQMNLDEWKTVKTGDFIKLDSCTLTSGGSRGKVRLTADGNLLFRGKLKDGSIKILENPLYREDWTPMPNKKLGNDDEENVDFSEAETDFTENEDEFTEAEDSEHFDESEEEDVLTEEELSEIEESKDGEEDEDEEPHANRQQEESLPTAHVQAQPLLSSKPLAPHEIPLDVVVEVGKIRMSFQKIMELQPGNLLELDVHPESGVDLVINGQKIARAELLSLGDHLGVRIIDIG